MVKKKREKVNKFDNYFLLSWKKVLFILIGFFVAVILHNAIDALFSYEEAVFFLIAVVIIPIYVFVVLIYSVIWLFVKKVLKK